MIGSKGIEHELIVMEGKVASIRGPLKVVEADLTSIISDPAVETLCRSVGILSAGFLFMNVHDGMIRFLGDRDRNAEEGGAKLEDGVRTPYFWRPDSDATLRECIPTLFSIVRRRQADDDISWSQEDRLLRIETEYTLNLPRNLPANSRDLLVSSDVAHKYDIHYPTIGEVWLTSLAWRRLCRARDAGLGDCVVSELPTDFADIESGRASMLWRGQPLTELASQEESLQLGPLLRRWSEDICPGSSWRAELSNYLTGATDEHLVDWRIRHAILFARRLGVSATLSDLWDVQRVDKVIRDAIAPLLAILEDVPTAITVVDAIERLERRSRLPILPFFVWNLVERAPVTFLACPVWTSQQFPLLVRQGRCHHLGLALCAVEPIEELEGRSLEDGEGHQLPNLRTTKAEVLVALLRMIARPLVEGSLYAPLVDELRRATEEEKAARSFFRGGDSKF